MSRDNLKQRAIKMLQMTHKVNRSEIIKNIGLFTPTAKIVYLEKWDARALDLALARALARARDLARDLDLDLDRDLARARDLDLDLDLDRDRARARALDRARARALDRAINRWLSIDCHYEALCVLNQNNSPEFQRQWMYFFQACEHGLYSAYLGADKTLYLLLMPKYISQDNERRLHNSDREAVSWLDKKFYYWHGIQVPERAITNINSYTARECLSEQNTEVRRALMSLYGLEKILPEVQAKKIDQHPNPMIGELFEFSDTDGTSLHVVRCLNGTLNHDGTQKWYYLFVPSSIGNVIDANKWTYPDCRSMRRDDFVEMQNART